MSKFELNNEKRVNSPEFQKNGSCFSAVVFVGLAVYFMLFEGVLLFGLESFTWLFGLNIKIARAIDKFMIPLKSFFNNVDMRFGGHWAAGQSVSVRKNYAIVATQS